MVKIKPLKHYINTLVRRCTGKFGEDFVTDNEELIEVTARNKRQLDRFDSEMDDAELTTMTIGSTGQQKEDINPIIKHRNDIAKLYADNLDALMLTPRARYKKQEKVNLEDTDPINDYFGAIH